MKMIDLKRTKKSKKDTAEAPALVGEDDYPYGLRISLEKEELDKLGLKLSDFKIGQACSMVAEGKIDSLRESIDKNNESMSVEIQITKLGLAAPKGKEKGAVQEFSDIKKAGPGGKVT